MGKAEPGGEAQQLNDSRRRRRRYEISTPVEQEKILKETLHKLSPLLYLYFPLCLSITGSVSVYIERYIYRCIYNTACLAVSLCFCPAPPPVSRCPT